MTPPVAATEEPRSWVDLMQSPWAFLAFVLFMAAPFVLWTLFHGVWLVTVNVLFLALLVVGVLAYRRWRRR